MSAFSPIASSARVIETAPITSFKNISTAINVTAIAAGDAHTCELADTGGVKCWGNNGDGQLGDGASTNRSMPVAVRDLSSGVTAIAAGGDHTCALTDANSVLCWGNNNHGQLGDDTLTDRSTPVAVNGLSSSVTAIAAGGDHTCALTSTGSVLCWGDNSYGQLGDGTTIDRLSPVAVSGLSSGVTAITAGGDHACALTNAGDVLCWGNNGNGQLGNGTTTDHAAPVTVNGLSSSVIAITAGGDHTCALTSIGSVLCWGLNFYGQLGDSTNTDRATPTAVIGLSSGMAAIASGGNHTCALTNTGGVLCWGYNDDGQLGDNTTSRRFAPVAASGLSSGVTTIIAGDLHTCALTSAGSVMCWGNNSHGELGNGTLTNRTMPVAVNGLSNAAIAIAAGEDHTCALTSTGGVLCWGHNVTGELGDGTITDRATPAAVNGLSDRVTAIAAGDAHTCALTNKGAVLCWGANWYGELGDGANINRTTPVTVSGLSSGVVAIAAGNFHTCALTSAGGVLCWGHNWYGELGDGTNTDHATPVAVSGLSSGVMVIAAGYGHTCALTHTGGVLCWGINGHGELGNGTTTGHNTPVAVSGLSSGVTAIAVGYGHTCALTNTGSMMCWGWNSSGQLGDSTNADHTTPVTVSGLSSGVIAITTGGDHTCALTSTGGVTCWGWNSCGELGDGTITDRSLPAMVSGLSRGMIGVAAGGYHTCALTSTGGVTCWGKNSYGQLGVNPGWIPVGVVQIGYSRFLPNVNAQER
jgi:alpha-tubulin suppressor-like RCC1 family protein